jgi:hypothetical protein
MRAERTIDWGLILIVCSALCLSAMRVSAQASDLREAAPRSNYFVVPKNTTFLTPTANFQDRREFEAVVYETASISNWDPFKEFPFAGKIVPIDNRDQREYFAEIYRRDFGTPETLNIFFDFLECAKTDCYKRALPTVWNWQPDQTPLCNHVVSLFRTNLFVRGIISRPVYFEFSDDDGGNSHTLTEVWSEDRGKWIYYDPFYGAYSTDSSISEILERGDLTGVAFVPGTINGRSLAARQSTLKDTFRDGWHFWSVPNLVAGVKFNFMNPKIYGTDHAPMINSETHAGDKDLKY